MNRSPSSSAADDTAVPAHGNCASAGLPITGLVLTFNEVDRIAICIESMRALCAQITVVDSGSTDGTVERATAAGATVISNPWAGFAAQRNFALTQASQPWVLFLDADESITPQLAQSIRGAFANQPDAQQRLAAADAFSMRFRTRFIDSTLRFGAPGSEKHVRLLRQHLRFPERAVHECIAIERGRTGRLHGMVLHDTARSIDHYADKLARYAQLFATDNHARGRRAGFLDCVLRSGFWWFKHYLLRLGFLDGTAGYVYHRLHAHYVFSKYARLWELTARARAQH